MKTDNKVIFDLLTKTVSLMRRGDYADSASLLNQFLQKMQSMITSETIPVKYIKMVTYSLETIYLMQSQQDWVAVADIIEFELIALLKKAFQST